MNTSIIRGRTLTFNRRPNSSTDTESYNFIEDGALFIKNGIMAIKKASSQFIEARLSSVQ